MKLSLPNIFSLSRILIAPFCFIAIISEKGIIVETGCILFLIGAITDYVDGWLARKYHDVTSWGKFIDPLADKILTTAAFLAFVILDIMPLWMVLIIILRDIGTTLIRIYADSINESIITSRSAKFKTFVQMTIISIILLLMFIKNLTIPLVYINNINIFIFSNYIYGLMLLLTLLTVWTGAEYIVNNKVIFHKLFYSLEKK